VMLKMKKLLEISPRQHCSAQSWGPTTLCAAPALLHCVLQRKVLVPRLTMWQHVSGSWTLWYLVPRSLWHIEFLGALSQIACGWSFLSTSGLISICSEPAPFLKEPLQQLQ
jgi:hypothetical protein